MRGSCLPPLLKPSTALLPDIFLHSLPSVHVYMWVCVLTHSQRKMDSNAGCPKFPHLECGTIPARPETNTSTFANSKSTAEFEFEFKSAGLPKPLEYLHEPSIPPFLSKTYDLVSDPSLDGIISWGENGNTFVVWNPLEFSRVVLPRNFKHSNFSSFVRQLNTYGFRKIDMDKWEFANEGFVKGQRHLLRGIQRRKSHQTGTSHEATKSPMEGEIEGLRKERSLMMQELVQLQHEQRGTAQHMDIVKKKLEATEKRQKQMVSFLAKVLQKPVLFSRLTQAKKQQRIGSTGHKYPKLQANETSSSTVEESAPFEAVEGIPSWVEMLPEDLVTDIPELSMAGVWDGGYEGHSDVFGPWDDLVHGDELVMGDGVADIWGTRSQQFGGSLGFEN